MWQVNNGRRHFLLSFLRLHPVAGDAQPLDIRSVPELDVIPTVRFNVVRYSGRFSMAHVADRLVG